MPDVGWYENSALGKVCNLEDPKRRLPQTGVRIYVLEPGKPNCRYHRESAQEEFLVLSGECTLLVVVDGGLIRPHQLRLADRRSFRSDLAHR